MSTPTRTHVFVGFANKFLECSRCENRVTYWHDPERCWCDGESFNHPCGHASGIVSICPSWEPILGCGCTNKETHDKE